MTLKEILKEMRKAFNERDLAGINEVITPEVYKLLTGYDIPDGVFVVGFGFEGGLDLWNVFDCYNYEDFDCSAVGINDVYYCQESFAKEQGWLKKERKPWTLEALKEEGWPVAVELQEYAVLSANFYIDGVSSFGQKNRAGFSHPFEHLGRLVSKIILADGTTLPPYNEE